MFCLSLEGNVFTIVVEFSFEHWFASHFLEIFVNSTTFIICGVISFTVSTDGGGGFLFGTFCRVMLSTAFDTSIWFETV